MTARMLTEADGPFVYQRIGEEYVASREGAALQWGFGTGKSRVVLTRLVRDERVLYTLLFCRLDNVDTLEKEIKKHTTLDYVKLTGKNESVRKVVEQFSSRLRNERSKTVFLLNYDKARYLTQTLKNLQADAVVVDESANIKRWEAARTKCICEIGHAPNVIFRAAMAGKMAPQAVENYWSQLYFVDKGATLGRSWYWFRNQYYIQVGYDWVLKPGARERLTELIAKGTSIMRTDDVRVPKRANRRVIELEPTKEQERYLAMLTEMAVRTPGGDIWVVDNGGVRFEKEKQVCGGYLNWPDEYGLEPLEFADNPKKDTLQHLLEDEFADRREPGEPKIVIWAYRHWEISQILTWLGEWGWRAQVIHGQQSPALNAYAKAQFFGNPEVRAIVGQADMGVGINEMVVADTMIWYSNSPKADSRDQAEARLDRPGQTRNVLNFLDLVLKEQADHAEALAVGYARMDSSGIVGVAKLMQEARRVAALRGAVVP